ncbi:MAG: hypothetical protein RIR00_2243 [Pseudomonadota bacterium]|jgi:hypothetical protein
MIHPRSFLPLAASLLLGHGALAADNPPPKPPGADMPPPTASPGMLSAPTPMDPMAMLYQRMQLLEEKLRITEARVAELEKKGKK